MKKISLLDEISKIISRNILVIVEGKKDKEALEKTGFNNVCVLSGKPLYKNIEEISKSNKECVILTDFDKKGRHIYHALKKELVRNGVKINENLRIALMREKVSHVEGLASYLGNRYE